MINTINNQTNTQTDKPATSPQPAPDQKTNTAAIPPAVKTTPAPPAQPDKPITKSPAETEIKTTMPAQNTDIASAESKKTAEQVEGDPAFRERPGRLQPETASSVAPDEPEEKTKESPITATEQAIKQTEKIQEKNKTEQKISENNIQKINKELPHQENDLAQFEIVEHEQEPPEKLGLKEAISTLPENKEPKADISKAPEPAITTMPESIPAQPANKPAKTDFARQFRDKLKQLLGIANKKRQAKAQANLDKIIKYAREKQKVTNDDVERITGIKDAQATKYLKKLVKQGRIVKFGKTSNTFYKPVK